jgi:hypothetical protein
MFAHESRRPLCLACCLLYAKYKCNSIFIINDYNLIDVEEDLRLLESDEIFRIVKMKMIGKLVLGILNVLFSKEKNVWFIWRWEN